MTSRACCCFSIHEADALHRASTSPMMMQKSAWRSRLKIGSWWAMRFLSSRTLFRFSNIFLRFSEVVLAGSRLGKTWIRHEFQIRSSCRLVNIFSQNTNFSSATIWPAVLRFDLRRCRSVSGYSRGLRTEEGCVRSQNSMARRVRELVLMRQQRRCEQRLHIYAGV